VRPKKKKTKMHVYSCLDAPLSAILLCKRGLITSFQLKGLPLSEASSGALPTTWFSGSLHWLLCEICFLSLCVSSLHTMRVGTLPLFFAGLSCP
jgi:hypothetical protein